MFPYKHVIIGGLLAVLILTVSWFFLARTSENTVSTFDSSRLVGDFYVTLLDPATHKSSVVTIAAEALDTRARVFSSEWTATRGIAFTPDGLTMAYVGEYGAGQIPQLFFTKTDKSGMGQLSFDANRTKKNMVWDAGGAHIAYAVRAEETTPSTQNSLSSYQVFVTDMTGTTSAITTGVPQFFSPDGTELFVMQGSGLRMIPLASRAQTTEFVTKAPSVAVPNAHISSSTKLSPLTKAVLSPDRHRLAWTLPEQGMVQVFGITEWAPFTLVLEKELPLTAVDPVFSPDGNSLALVDISGDNVGENIYLTVYDLATYASKRIFDMKTLEGEFLELSSWR